MSANDNNSDDEPLPFTQRGTPRLATPQRIREPSHEATPQPPSSPASAPAIESTRTWTSATAPQLMEDDENDNAAEPIPTLRATQEHGVSPLAYFTPREQTTSQPNSSRGQQQQRHDNDVEESGRGVGPVSRNAHPQEGTNVQDVRSPEPPLRDVDSDPITVTSDVREEECEATSSHEASRRPPEPSPTHVSSSPGAREESSDTATTMTTSFRFYGLEFATSAPPGPHEEGTTTTTSMAATTTTVPMTTSASTNVATTKGIAMPAEIALRHRNVYDMAQSGSTLVVSPVASSTSDTRERESHAAATSPAVMTPVLTGLVTEMDEEGGSGASLHWFSESSGAETSGGSGATGTSPPAMSTAGDSGPTHVPVMIVVVDRGTTTNTNVATRQPSAANDNDAAAGKAGTSGAGGSSSSTETEGSGAHEEFAVDELMELPRPDCGPVSQAKLIRAMQRHCLRGHNTVLVIAHTPTCTTFAEECMASVLQCTYAQLREATDRDLALASRLQSVLETCDVTLSAYALRTPAEVYSLLPAWPTGPTAPRAKRLPAVLAANPLSGVHICSDALVTITTQSELRRAIAHMRDMLHGLRIRDSNTSNDERHGVEKGKMVWVAMDVKQRRRVQQGSGPTPAEALATREATSVAEAVAAEKRSEDVYVFSMQMVLVGSSYATRATLTPDEHDAPPALAHDMGTPRTHSLALLQRQIFHGPMRSTVLALVDRGDSARQTRELLHFVRAARVCVNEPPRSGSVRRFLSLTHSLVQAEPVLTPAASSSLSTLPATTSSSTMSGAPQTAMVRAMRADAALLLLQPHVPVPLYYVVTSHDRCAVRRRSVEEVVPLRPTIEREEDTSKQKESTSVAEATERSTGLQPTSASAEPRTQVTRETVSKGEDETTTQEERRPSVVPPQAFITSRHNSNQDEDTPRAGSGLAAARRGRVPGQPIRPRLQARRFTQDEDEEGEEGSKIVGKPHLRPVTIAKPHAPPPPPPLRSPQPRLSQSHGTNKAHEEESQKGQPHLLGRRVLSRHTSPQSTIQDTQEEEQDIEEQHNVNIL